MIITTIMVMMDMTNETIPSFSPSQYLLLLSWKEVKRNGKEDGQRTGLKSSYRPIIMPSVILVCAHSFPVIFFSKSLSLKCDLKQRK